MFKDKRDLAPVSLCDRWRWLASLSPKRAGQPPGFQSLTFLTYGSLDLLSPGPQLLSSFLRNGQSSQTTASVQKIVTGDNQGTRTCRVAAFDGRKERLRVFSEVHAGIPLTASMGCSVCGICWRKGLSLRRKALLFLGGLCPEHSSHFLDSNPQARVKGTHHPLPSLLPFP